MLLGTLGASLLGNMLTGKGNKKGKGMLRAGCGKKKKGNKYQQLAMEIKRIFNAASSFNKLSNTKVLSKLT